MIANTELKVTRMRLLPIWSYHRGILSAGLWKTTKILQSGQSASKTYLGTCRR